MRVVSARGAAAEWKSRGCGGWWEASPCCGVLPMALHINVTWFGNDLAECRQRSNHAPFCSWAGADLAHLERAQTLTSSAGGA